MDEASVHVIDGVELVNVFLKNPSQFILHMRGNPWKAQS